MSKHFPPKREKVRFSMIKKNRAIYDGDHRAIFNRDKKHLYIDHRRKKILYIAVNLAAKISEYYSSLILGDGVFFDVDNDKIQEQVNAIVKDNDFFITLLEGAIDQSRYGYFVLRVREEEDVEGNKKAVIEQVPDDQFVVEFTHDLKPKIKSITLFAFLKIEDDKGKERKYLFKEIYFYPNGKVEREEVFITNELWLLDKNDDSVKKVNLALLDSEIKEEIRTGINFIPIRIINNSKPSEFNFGKSDYKDNESLFEELNDKVSMVSKQLQKHMNSKMAVPQGTLDQDGNVKASEADIFEVGGDEMIPQYITNSNSQIDQAFKHIESTIREIAAISQMPLESFGFDHKGGVESPEGFRLRNFETQKRIEKKRLYMESHLQFIINTSLLFEGTKEKQKIDVKWSNVLPEDEKLKTDILSLQVASELKSKRTAIKELQKIDEAQLDEEIERIKQDSVAGTASLNEETLPSAQTLTTANALIDNL